MRKVAIGQAGGPTAVLNASLVGLVEGLYGNSEIYPVRDGYQGLVERKYGQLNQSGYEWVKQHDVVPGACLGAGRYDFSPDLMERALNQLKQDDIHTLAFIGGNGTMAALQRMEDMARHMGYELQTIGVPKTVDNDLCETDHAPGFASAARYVMLSVRNIVKDLEAMRNFEQVRIIETMGRNAGWLALSSGYLRSSDQDGPQHIYIPEIAVSSEEFLKRVGETVKANGTATIVVSEGFSFAGEDKVERNIVNGRQILGGISSRMEQLIRDQFGYNVRSENLGMNQRSASYAVSLQDRQEAYEVGRKAALYIKQDLSGHMVNIQRQVAKCYNYTIGQVPLEQVVRSGERLLPAAYLASLPEYYDWLGPILGEPIAPYPAKWREIKNESTIYPKFGRS